MRQAVLVLGRFGVNESRICQMTEPELLAWIDSAIKLINPKHGRFGSVTEKTTHVQSLRRRKPRPKPKSRKPAL